MDLFSAPWPWPLQHGDLCGLPSTPWAHPLCCGVCVHLFLLTQACPLSQGLCFSSSWACPLCCMVCVHCGGLCMPPSWPPRPALCIVRFAWAAEVCTLGLSWHPRPTLCARGLLWASLSSLSLPSGQGYSLWVVSGLRSAAFSAFCPLSPCFAWLSEILQLPLGPTCKGASQCTGTVPPSQLSPSLGTQAPVQKFSMSSHFMSPSSLLPHFREVSLPPLEAWLLMLSPRVCFVGVVPYLDEFWCVCGEAGNLPISTLPPSSSSPCLFTWYSFM